MRCTSRTCRSLFLVVPAAFLLTAGCIPVGWLPDSSGFLYVTGEKPEIVRYDVASGKKNVIVRDLPRGTVSPAISPDGKRFAVARIVSRGEGKPADIQVLVYDLQGKEVHKSPLVLWRQENREDNLTSVYWSRGRDKLIVSDYQDKPRTGLYDLQGKTFVFVEGTPCAFGGNPLRPDDKGFLVMRPREEKDRLALVNWEGKAEPIRLDETLLRGEGWTDTLLMPWTGTSSWEKNVAVVIHKDGLARIDTDKRTGVAEKAPADPLTAGLDPVLQRHDFPGKGPRARVVERTADGAKFHHLLVWKPGEKKPEDVFKVKKGFLVLSPSPDGKWLAVRAMGDDLEGFEVLLLSKDGEVKIVRAKE